MKLTWKPLFLFAVAVFALGSTGHAFGSEADLILPNLDVHFPLMGNLGGTQILVFGILVAVFGIIFGYLT